MSAKAIEKAVDLWQKEYQELGALEFNSRVFNKNRPELKTNKLFSLPFTVRIKTNFDEP